jgi:hypothetical protein
MLTAARIKNEARSFIFSAMTDAPAPSDFALFLNAMEHPWKRIGALAALAGMVAVCIVCSPPRAVWGPVLLLFAHVCGAMGALIMLPLIMLAEWATTGRVELAWNCLGWFQRATQDVALRGMEACFES